MRFAKSLSIRYKVTCVRRGNPYYRWNGALALQMLKRCIAALAEWRHYLVVSTDPEDMQSVKDHIEENFLADYGSCYVGDPMKLGFEK